MQKKKRHFYNKCSSQGRPNLYELYGERIIFKKQKS